MRELYKRFDIEIDTSKKLNYPGEFLLPKEAKILKGIDFVLLAGNAALSYDTGSGMLNIPENILNNIDCKGKLLESDNFPPPAWIAGGNVFLQGNVAFSGVAGTLNLLVNGKIKQNIPVEDRMFFYELVWDSMASLINDNEEQKSVVDFNTNKIQHNFNSYLPLNLKIDNHRIAFNFNSNENPAFSQLLADCTESGLDFYNFSYLPISKYKVFVYLKYTI